MTPIARFEKRYKINKKGEVLNLANNKNLSPIELENGYLKVGLAIGNGRHEQVLIHRLVALHFLPNPYFHNEINHIDGNKKNNHVSNLEWCSTKENINHALQTGLRPGYMSAEDKEKYLNIILSGTKVVDLAASIGRGQESLSKMLRMTAQRLGKEDLWKQVMKENRRATAIRNLSKINA